MGFVRSSKLRPEIEAQLKDEMKPLWDGSFSAIQIAYKLGFGEPRLKKLLKDYEPDPRYEKLKAYHVYFYRSKFKFKRRRTPPRAKGKTRYKIKHDEVMTFEQFKNTLNEKVAKNSVRYCQRMRAFLILLYWTPLRNTEIIERTRADFSMISGSLKIDLYRKKKYYHLGKKSEPFYLRMSYPLVDEVVDYILTVDDPDERPFNFTRWTAWNYVRQVFEGYYPHFFRFNYITRGVNNAKDAGQLITTLLGDTGLNISTVSEYIMQNPRFRNTLNDRQMELLGLKR